MLTHLIKLNHTINTGCASIAWFFYFAAGTGAVLYALSLLHLAIFSILAPIILIAIFYYTGKAHERAIP